MPSGLGFSDMLVVAALDVGLPLLVSVPVDVTFFEFLKRRSISWNCCGESPLAVTFVAGRD